MGYASASSASACVALSMCSVNFLGSAALITRFIDGLRVSRTVLTISASVFCGQSRPASRYFFVEKYLLVPFRPAYGSIS